MSDRTVFDITGYTRVTCRYFKDSGKYYSEGVCYVQNAIIEKEIYPKAVGKFLLASRSLPGLESGNWQGPFTCHVNDKYEELVIQ